MVCVGHVKLILIALARVTNSVAAIKTVGVEHIEPATVAATTRRHLAHSPTHTTAKQLRANRFNRVSFPLELSSRV